jgi:uncharacterized protein YicC (UPF0701 family)
MLLDELNSTVKRLSQLDKKETAIQNAEKKAKNDRDYSTLTADLHESMRKLKYAHEEMGYSLSDDTLQLLDDNLSKLQETIDAGVVDEDILSTTKQQINRILNPTLSREWKDFHGKKTNSVVGKLATIGSLAPDKSHIDAIRENISDSNDWSTLSDKVNASTTKIMRFKYSIEEVDKIEEGLNLNDDIKQFISLVTREKAKITDLNEEIISWIQQANLEDKFIIRFR